MAEEIYHRLADHLKDLTMGYPFSNALMELLQETYTPTEARVALAIPNDLQPLQVASTEEITARSDLPAELVETTLISLAERNLLYTAPMPDDAVGYALFQVGYGIPQAFFWGGQQDERAKRMAGLIFKYFTVDTTEQIYGGSPTKGFTYTPAGATVEVGVQGVLPHAQMAPIVEKAARIAVAHCPCRLSARLLGRTDCPHSLEVCIKYDELAEFTISRGLSREISRDEALHIFRESEKEGLVHMVDNTRGKVKHTCNCCGHYCWNVGIIRRRKVPRDVLMAVYFIRETDSRACIGCGACAEICPVDAVQMVDSLAQADPGWCIGCGVCAGPCPTGAISIKQRSPARPPKTFVELHRNIRIERGLARD